MKETKAILAAYKVRLRQRIQNRTSYKCLGCGLDLKGENHTHCHWCEAAGTETADNLCAKIVSLQNDCYIATEYVEKLIVLLGADNHLIPEEIKTWLTDAKTQKSKSE